MITVPELHLIGGRSYRVYPYRDRFTVGSLRIPADSGPAIGRGLCVSSNSNGVILRCLGLIPEGYAAYPAVSVGPYPDGDATVSAVRRTADSDRLGAAGAGGTGTDDH